jgi:hypothetical protein
MRTMMVMMSTSLPQLLAGFDVKKGNGKEERGEEQHGYILHRDTHKIEYATGCISEA